MKVKPTIVAERMKLLREGVKLSQGKLASMLGMQQTAVYRYEVGQSFPPYQVLMKYADFFDVSLDYIFGRTDSPQGKLYDCQAKVLRSENRGECETQRNAHAPYGRTAIKKEKKENVDE